MLRRIVIVLLSYSFPATCRAGFYRPNARHDRSTTVDVGQRWNSIEYQARRTDGFEARGDRAAIRVAGTIGGGTLENGVVGTGEAAPRKKKDKGYGQALLYLLGAAKMTMLYLLANGVAAIAGKALIVAKVAMAIAIAIALKKASEEHDEKASYRIVKHPHYSYEHTHSSSVDLEHDLGEHGVDYRDRRRTHR